MNYLKMLWVEFLTLFNWRIKLKIKNTMRCDLKCPYCCVDIAQGRVATWEELDWQEWIKIIDAFPLKVGILILIGGEPFFRKDAVDLINACTERGIIVKVLTNCTYKRMLDVNPTPFVKFLITYHHHLDKERWMKLYLKIKAKYRTKLYEVGNQVIPGGEVLDLICNENDGCYYRRDFIFTPNGELNMCIMDTCHKKGYQAKRKWEMGTPGQMWSIYDFKEKLNLIFLRNLRYRIKNAIR